MKLINADRVVHWQTYDDEHETYPEYTGTIAEFLDQMTDEGCPEAIDAVTVRHGQWIINIYKQTVCSECKSSALWVMTGCIAARHLEACRTPYCPNCGARMDGKGNSNETD